MYLTLSVRTLKSQLFKPSSESFRIQEVLKRALHYFETPFFYDCMIQHIMDGLGTDQDRVEVQIYEDPFDECSR